MAQVNSPHDRPDSALDMLVKGLGIASSIYGIKTNMAQLDDFKQKQTDRQNEAAGKLNKGQRIKLGETFDISETPTAVGMQPQASDLETGTPLYLSIKKKAQSPIIRDIAAQRGGKAGLATFDYASGKPVELGFEETPAKQAGTREIQTVDAQGKPVISIVPDVAGTSFAAQPKQKDDKLVPVNTVDAQGKNVIKFVTPTAGAAFVAQTKPGDNDPFTKLPMVAQTQVKDLSAKIAAKTDIANLMDSELNNFKSAYLKGDNTQAIKSGEGMYKLLNSAVSTDAVSKDEAERLGSLLQIHIIPNITNPGPYFDRDLKGFYEQVASKNNAIKSSAEANQQRINDIFAGKYDAKFTKTDQNIGAYGANKPRSGTAMAADEDPAAAAARDSAAKVKLDALKIKAAGGDEKAINYLNFIGVK